MGAETLSRRQGDDGCCHGDEHPVWMVLLPACVTGVGENLLPSGLVELRDRKIRVDQF